MTLKNIHTVLKSNKETFEKYPFLLNLGASPVKCVACFSGVSLEFQSATYSMVACLPCRSARSYRVATSAMAGRLL